MMELQEEIDELMSEKMTKEKFWGMAMLDDEVPFDYGRDIFKEESYDRIINDKFLPYHLLPLYTKGDWNAYAGQAQEITIDSGMMRSGKLSSAYIKADIKLYDATEDSDCEPEDDDEEEEESDDEEERDPEEIKLALD